MRAAIYTRVSQDKAQGRSVQEQEAECLAVAEREGWTVVRTFSDNDRGASKFSKGSRPAYGELLSFIGAGSCDAVLTWENSRAQRDMAAYVGLADLCESVGVLWSYSGRTYDLSNPDDRMATGLDALLAERESAVTRKRVLRAMRANASAGRPHGKLLYGYERTYDATGALVGQVVREDQATIIRECARRFLAGEPCYAIASDLNARGVVPPRAKSEAAKWTLTQVKRLLTNPAYIAKRVHKGEVVGEAGWPAISDEATFYRCAAKFADPSRKTSHDSAVKFLLSGIASCGVCGGRIKVGRPRGYDSYICVNHCVARSVPPVDELVTEVVLERLSQPDALTLFSTDDGTEEVLTEISMLKARLDEFYDTAASGELSAAALARIEPGILAQIKEAEGRLKRADVPTVIYDLVDAPREVWPALSLPQKRECLKVLLDVRVNRTQRGQRIFDPKSVEINFVGSDATEQAA